MILFEYVSRMRVITITIALLALLSQPVASQLRTTPAAAERKAVLVVVQGFFDTMTARDAEGAGRVLLPEGRFFSTRKQDGRDVVRSFTNAEYIKGLANGKERFRERMWDPTVLIRGDIATVWTSYDFWIDGKLSHCGIDSFNLIRKGGKWKIAGGVYTVERKCEPSPLGPLK